MRGMGVAARWRGLLYRLYARRLEAEVRRRPTPRHVGIILDGNRRWARAQGRDPVDAYRVGAGKLDEVLAWCTERGCRGVDALALPGNRETKNFFETAGLVARAIVVHKRLVP